MSAPFPRGYAKVRLTADALLDMLRVLVDEDSRIRARLGEVIPEMQRKAHLGCKALLDLYAGTRSRLS